MTQLELLSKLHRSLANEMSSIVIAGGKRGRSTAEKAMSVLEEEMRGVRHLMWKCVEYDYAYKSCEDTMSDMEEGEDDKD